MAQPTFRIISDSVSCRIVATEQIDAKPYGFRVEWIKWDSGFRGTALRIDDRIIGLDGQRYDVASRQDFASGKSYDRAPGGYNETAHWTERGTADGTEVTLTVYRHGEIIDVRGKVLAERRWYTEEDRQAVGEGGPDATKSTEFGDGWGGWYDKRVDFWSRVLCYGWHHQTGFPNRAKLAEHLEDKARIDLLVEKYPGRFSQVAKQDWDTVYECLLGKKYELGPQDLAYRELGEKRVAQVAAAAAAARTAFVDAEAAEVIDAFPAVDPFHGDKSKVVGKVIVLPPLTPRDFVSDSGRTYLVCGDRGRGFYFVLLDSPPMQRLFGAGFRYQKLVTPQLGERYALVARITQDLKMLVSDGNAVTGLLLDVLAGTVGDNVFVDLTKSDGEVSPFAGEEALGAPLSSAPADDASPRQVMEAFIAALKAGDEKLWRALFASWEAVLWNDGQVYYYPHNPPSEQSLSDDWVRARRLISDPVYDVRVSEVYEVVRLMTGQEFDGAPVIDQVAVEVDHIGLFDGEYRAYCDINLRRAWVLQRIGSGPWRIASRQAI